MNYLKAVHIIQKEKECVIRASHEGCNRDCGKCGLLMDSQDIIEAYDTAIEALLSKRVLYDKK